MHRSSAVPNSARPAPMSGSTALRSANSIRRIRPIAASSTSTRRRATRAACVEYRSDICILRPADPERGNGRILYEVNNRGRIMLFANLCAGKAGQPTGRPRRISATRCRCGAASPWCGPAGTRVRRVPMADLGLDAPVATDNGAPIVRRIREEFISGTRGGDLKQFRLSYEAATRDDAVLTVRRTQTAPRQPVAFEFVDARTVRLAQGACRNPARSTNCATMRRTRACWASALPRRATSSAICATARPGATCSVASRRMRWPSASRRPDAICAITSRRASIATKTGARVFDGVFTHVAGIGRVFFNTEFGQPARTRTWHEDHGFPEVEFPFATGCADARRRQRSEADRDQHLDGILAEGRVAAAHRSRRHARRRAAGECARLLPAGHAAWRQGRHAARCRPMHQSAQLARPDAGDPRAAGGARRMGDERPRTAAIAPAAHRRRHAGARRGGGVAEACDAGAAACGERCGGARRLDRSAAAGTRMAGAGAAGRCGRQRDRRHPPARHRRTARHVHRLEPVPAPLPAGELADRDGTYLAFAATRSRTRACRRSAPFA